MTRPKLTHSPRGPRQLILPLPAVWLPRGHVHRQRLTQWGATQTESRQP